MFASRESDEELLTMLSAKSNGATWAGIGRALGKTGNNVQVRCRDIRNGDLAESGEPESTVMEGYW